jgi:hypothetical protein
MRGTYSVIPQNRAMPCLSIARFGDGHASLNRSRAAGREDRHRGAAHRWVPHDRQAPGRRGCAATAVQADTHGRAAVVDAGRKEPTRGSGWPTARRLTPPRMRGPPDLLTRNPPGWHPAGSIASAEFNKHMNCLARSRAARKPSRTPAAHLDAAPLTALEMAEPRFLLQRGRHGDAQSQAEALERAPRFEWGTP